MSNNQNRNLANYNREAEARKEVQKILDNFFNAEDQAILEGDPKRRWWQVSRAMQGLHNSRERRDYLIARKAELEATLELLRAGQRFRNIETIFETDTQAINTELEQARTQRLDAERLKQEAQGRLSRQSLNEELEELRLKEQVAQKKEAAELASLENEIRKVELKQYLKSLKARDPDPDPEPPKTKEERLQVLIDRWEETKAKLKTQGIELDEETWQAQEQLFEQQKTAILHEDD